MGSTPIAWQATRSAVGRIILHSFRCDLTKTTNQLVGRMQPDLWFELAIQDRTLDMPWTEDRVEILKARWLEGKSASEIAKELGDVTRNAVIGKLHRLGLSHRKLLGKTGRTVKVEQGPQSPEPEKPEQTAKPEPVKPEAPAEDTNDSVAAKERQLVRKVTQAQTIQAIIASGKPLPPQPSPNDVSEEARAMAEDAEKLSEQLDLMQLTEKTCKWPIGDPAEKEFWFCGLPSQPGKPYCEAHGAVAYQPMSVRRDRRAK